MPKLHAVSPSPRHGTCPPPERRLITTASLIRWTHTKIYELQAALLSYLKPPYLLLIPSMPRPHLPIPMRVYPTRQSFRHAEQMLPPFPRVRQHVCRLDCNP